MGQAIIQIETYDNGLGTRIRYVPENINPHVVISALQMLLRKIISASDNSGEMVEWNKK